MKVLDQAVVNLLPAVPRRVVQRLSGRYIAGPTLEDARHTVASLNAEGKYATVDVLGEEVTEAAEAEAIANAYHKALEAIHGDQLESNISVKLTALGLQIDLDLCRALLGELVEDAASRDTFVRIDMEDSSCTDDTIALYRELRERGRDNVGIVLQSRLKRSLADVDALAETAPERPHLQGHLRRAGGDRVSGARPRARELPPAPRRAARGREPRRHRDARRVAPRTCASTRLRARSEGVRAADAARRARGARLEPRRRGHRVRIYVPYGQKWYEYSLRRLQENPALAGMIARETVLRVVPGRG